MAKSRLTHNMIMIAFCLVLLVVIITKNCPAGASLPPSTTTIHAFNPYRLKINLEIKCDFNRKQQDYTYHQFIMVYGKSDTRIVTPSNLKYCEIWPKIIW